MSDEFRFDLNAKRVRLSDDDLMAALETACEALGGGYFTHAQYDGLPGKRPYSGTIAERFGSWKKALALIGVIGGREGKYSPEQLVANLENVWKKLGFPPGKRQIANHGDKISEHPYVCHWGSVRIACEALAAFHEGKITKEQLLAGNTQKPTRKAIPLKVRWAVLKRDNYRCAKCGRSPATDHNVELNVDHNTSVCKRGSNDFENLQTLCWDCNQGKKVDDVAKPRAK